MGSTSPESIEHAWMKAQRFAVLAEAAEHQDERLFFLKLYDSWARTARVLETLQQKRLKLTNAGR
jgi:hypothetical protein